MSSRPEIQTIFLLLWVLACCALFAVQKIAPELMDPFFTRPLLSAGGGT